MCGLCSRSRAGGGRFVQVFKKDKAEEAGEQVRHHCAVMAEHEQELLDMMSMRRRKLSTSGCSKS